MTPSIKRQWSPQLGGHSLDVVDQFVSEYEWSGERERFCCLFLASTLDAEVDTETYSNTSQESIFVSKSTQWKQRNRTLNSNGERETNSIFYFPQLFPSFFSNLYRFLFIYHTFSKFFFFQ